jgi:mannose-6-phosphate isomerase-like protein (cupin superfamily)
MYTKIINNAETLIKPPTSDRLKAGCVVLRTGKDVGEHITENKEEILIILQGKASIVCENQTKDVTQKTMVFIPKNKKHNVINKSKGILRYIYIVNPLNE